MSRQRSLSSVHAGSLRHDGSTATATRDNIASNSSVHEFNHNIHLLDEWIAEIIKQSKQNYIGADVNVLLEYLDQYNMCFEEPPVPASRH